jgi:transketolase
MRTPSAVLYGPDYRFEFGQAQYLRSSDRDTAVIVSSGRGVHEALAAAAECDAHGVRVGVLDMPTIDEESLLRLQASGRLVMLAEQNNGYILQNLLKIVHRRHVQAATLSNVLAVNTLDEQGRPQFIHSGTYEELVNAFGLSARQLAAAIRKRVKGEDV